MGLCKFIFTQIERLHAVVRKHADKLGDFRFTRFGRWTGRGRGRAGEEERADDEACPAGRVAVGELRHGSPGEEVVEFDKADCHLRYSCTYETWAGATRRGECQGSRESGGILDIRSGMFGDFEAHQHFPAFTQLGTFRYESESAKVHVATADDGNELLATADEVVADDVGFQAGE